MAKASKSNGGDAAEAAEAATDASQPKKGFVRNLLGSRKLLLIGAAGGLILILGCGAGAYFLFFGKSLAPAAQTAAAIPLVPPQVAFYDMPDVIVNLQTPNGSPAYLKLGVSLELVSAQERAGLQALKPRIVDHFQAYLHELRTDDLKGSAGVLRLKEELLRRANLAAAPYPVKDVLLKEMVVQ